jgi:hypothetical protein
MHLAAAGTSRRAGRYCYPEEDALMGQITTLDELDHAIRIADDRARLSDSAMRDHLGSFTVQFGYPLLDPFSEAYRKEVVRQYEAVSGRSFGLSNEHTDYDDEAAISRPYPILCRIAGTDGRLLYSGLSSS